MSTPTSPITPGAALRAGADLIEREGKREGELWRGLGPTYPGGPCCALGSLLAVCATPANGDHPTVSEADYALRLHLGLRPADSVAWWSDCSTADEVVAAMRATADELDGGAS